MFYIKAFSILVLKNSNTRIKSKKVQKYSKTRIKEENMGLKKKAIILFVLPVILLSSIAIAGIAYKTVYGNYTTTGGTVYVSSNGQNVLFEESIRKYWWIDDTIYVKLIMRYTIRLDNGNVIVRPDSWPIYGCAENVAYKRSEVNITNAKATYARLLVYGIVCNTDEIDGTIDIYATPNGPIPAP